MVSDSPTENCRSQKQKVTEVDYTKEIPSAQITIHCQNPTDRDLSDVIQVYVHVNGSSNEVPNHKLAAFERIRLDAGESKNSDHHSAHGLYHGRQFRQQSI